MKEVGLERGVGWGGFKKRTVWVLSPGKRLVGKGERRKVR